MFDLSIREFLPQLQSDFEAQPCFPIVDGNHLFLAINSANPKAYDNTGNSCFLICVELDQQKLKWSIAFDGTEGSTISNEFLLEGDHIFISTTKNIHCIHKLTGKVIWQTKFKSHDISHISICDNRLFFSKWGELQELNKEKGKVTQTIKPRVNWFDSGIRKHNGRYFISTSNSKILELSIDKFEVINEFKFPGGWAIGVSPLFYEDEMISTSFGGKILFFNLSTNQANLKLNRKAGAVPLQILAGHNVLFYEGLLVNNLSCYDLKSKKRKWKKVLPKVEYLQEVSQESFLAVYKKDRNYVVSLFETNSGKETKVVLETSYENWDVYKYRLWKGVRVSLSRDYEVYSVEPNKVTVKRL